MPIVFSATLRDYLTSWSENRARSGAEFRRWAECRRIHTPTVGEPTDAGRALRQSDCSGPKGARMAKSRAGQPRLGGSAGGSRSSPSGSTTSTRPRPIETRPSACTDASTRFALCRVTPASSAMSCCESGKASPHRPARRPPTNGATHGVPQERATRRQEQRKGVALRVRRRRAGTDRSAAVRAEAAGESSRCNTIVSTASNVTAVAARHVGRQRVVTDQIVSSHHPQDDSVAGRRRRPGRRCDPSR